MQSPKILSSKMFILLFILIIKLDVLIAPNVSEGTAQRAHTNPILPLVMIRTEDGQLIRPTDLPRSETDNNKFLFGTEFSGMKKGKQLFFCGGPQYKKNVRTLPRGDDGDPENQYISNELCVPGLVTNKKNYLQCSREPEPYVLKLSKKDDANEETVSEIYCGSIFHRESKMFAFVYKVQTNDDSKTHIIEIYRFCYDVIKQKVVYTEHTIASPKLLGSQSLEQEREKIYETSDKGYRYFGTRFETIKKAYEDFLEQKKGEKVKVGGLESSKITSKSQLNAKSLIPADDMAFGLWRKPTYHTLNTKLMADDKSELWDYISDLIRTDAMNKSREYLIHTGAFNVTSEGKNENELIESPDFWIKLVQYRKEDDTEFHESIAIVMVHNPKIEMVDNIFKDICKENMCKNAFDPKEHKNGNSVCCTTTMAKVDFFFDLNLKNPSPLKIEKLYGINEQMPTKMQEVSEKIKEEASTYSQMKETLAVA